jgi:site-specific recombinase XerD
MPRRRGLPPYRLHKHSGQAVCHIGGKDVYLGLHGSEESKKKYEDIVRHYLAEKAKAEAERRVRKVADLTIAELARDYLEFARAYYVKAGEITSEFQSLCAALRPLRERHAECLVSHFTPAHLEEIRERWIAEGVVRNQINKRVDRVRRMFRWGVKKSLVRPDILEALRAVDGLKKGRTKAKERPKVRPVPDDVVDATLPYLRGPVRAMVEIQRLTGARPGEIVILRAADLITTGDVWEYRPAAHKLEHLDIDRVVFIGPRAQQVLKPLLTSDPGKYVFSPADASAEQSRERREARKTKLYDSHVTAQAKKRKRSPRRSPGDRYDVASYRRAIRYAIQKANKGRRANGLPDIPAWSPNRLRHSAATTLRRDYDLDTSKAVLGHTSPEVTARFYAELDAEKARRAMRELG